MKTHRSTQPFLYIYGGERSVKCVRPELEMEACKEEQRGVVHFLVAEGAPISHSPCDFHIFGDLKKDIRGRRFHSDEDVQEWVRL